MIDGVYDTDDTDDTDDSDSAVSTDDIDKIYITNKSTAKKSFKCLTLEQYNKNKSIDPNSNKPIIITPNFTVILFETFFDRDLESIPKYVEKLEFGHGYKFSTKLFPHSLKILVVGNSYISPLILPKNIIFLKTGRAYRKPLKLTKKLLHLRVGEDFLQSIKISKNLMTLYLKYNYNKHIELPKHIVHVKISHIVAESIIFTPYISNISIYLPNEDDPHEKFIFEYPHKEVRLYRIHFWGWDGCHLSNNVKNNILICYYHLNKLDNVPSNIVVNCD